MFINLNKNTKLFDIEVENPIFKKLSEFNTGDVLKVRGMYVNKKSNFGDSPIFIVEDLHSNIFFVNMPKNHLETINTIIADSTLVQGVNNGECFIEVIQYWSKRFNKNCFDFQFIEKPTNTAQTQPQPQQDIF